MTLSASNRRNLRHATLGVVSLLFCQLCGVANADDTPSAIWSPTELSETLRTGDNSQRTVSFTLSGDDDVDDGIRLIVSDNLRPFLRTSPSFLGEDALENDDDEASSIQVTLIFDIPEDVPGQILEGSIALRSLDDDEDDEDDEDESVFLAGSLPILLDIQALGTVTGGVFYFSDSVAVSDATVILVFSESGATHATTADADGLFIIDGVEPEGAFVVTAEDGSGAAGTAQGALLEEDLEPSVLVLIDQPGAGLIQGTVQFDDGTPASNALVTASFPETGRTQTTLTDADGNYSLTQLQFDGTAIVIAFDSATGSSASFSSVVAANFPSPTINLILQTPPFVNPELVNNGFTDGPDGLTGWYSSGPVQIVDRDLVFGSQAN